MWIKNCNKLFHFLSSSNANYYHHYDVINSLHILISSLQYIISVKFYEVRSIFFIYECFIFIMVPNYTNHLLNIIISFVSHLFSNI